MTIDRENILQGITFNCPKNFQCLDNGHADMCQVSGRIGEIGICVDSQNGAYCQLQFRFPVSTVCICPVRKRLYMLYGI